jgi:hypothetical protein
MSKPSPRKIYKIYKIKTDADFSKKILSHPAAFCRRVKMTFPGERSKLRRYFLTTPRRRKNEQKRITTWRNRNGSCRSHWQSFRRRARSHGHGRDASP